MVSKICVKDFSKPLKTFFVINVIMNIFILLVVLLYIVYIGISFFS